MILPCPDFSYQLSELELGRLSMFESVRNPGQSFLVRYWKFIVFISTAYRFSAL